MFDTDLTKSEKRKAYNSIIDIGSDVKSQKNKLESISKEIIHSQLAAASEIVISQERINDSISSLGDALYDIYDGINSLNSTFEWGFANLIWQLELNNKRLKNILETLEAPLDTQARERRKRAVDAYQNGWIDDALEEFLASENLNKFDFTIHISLGTIYLDFKNDITKSLEYFDKAIKYARPKSSLHTSYALLYKGHIKHLLNQTKEAAECAEEAIRLSNNLAEAHYQYGQYNSLLNNKEFSIASLRSAIELDKNYSAKAVIDSNYKNVKSEVLELLKQMTREVNAIAKCDYEDLLSIFNNTSSNLKELSNIIKIDMSEYDFIKNKINEIDSILLINKYLDQMYAITMIKDMKDNLKKYIEKTMVEIDSKVRFHNEASTSLAYSLEQEKNVQTVKVSESSIRYRKICRITGFIILLIIAALNDNPVLLIFGFIFLYIGTSLIFTGSYRHSNKYEKLLNEKLNHESDKNKLSAICKSLKNILKDKKYIETNDLTDTNSSDKHVNVALSDKSNKDDFKKYCLRCTKKYKVGVNFCDECGLELEYL